MRNPSSFINHLVLGGNSIQHLFAQQRRWLHPRGLPRGLHGPQGRPAQQENHPNVDRAKVKRLLKFWNSSLTPFSIFSRTPMMDLLVHICTINKLSPSGHVIQVMNERSDDFLYYKPSTPIGKVAWRFSNLSETSKVFPFPTFDSHNFQASKSGKFICQGD